MKSLIVSLMNWMARPFPSANVIVLAIVACMLFLGGIALAWHGYITEVLEVLHAPKLRLAIRIGAFLFLSCYCTLGCFCRIIIQFWPEEFSNEYRTN